MPKAKKRVLLGEGMVAAEDDYDRFVVLYKGRTPYAISLTELLGKKIRLYAEVIE